MQFKFIFSFITCLSLFIAFSACKQQETPKEKKPVEIKTVDNQLVNGADVKPSKIANSEVILSTKGVIKPQSSLNVQFAVDGLLESGEQMLFPGNRFKKGQLLFQLNNQLQFEKIKSAKNDLVLRLKAFKKEFEKQFPVDAIAYAAFVENLTPEMLLPEYPLLTNREAVNFLNENKISEAYKLVASLESAMANYFYLAPYDGVVGDIFIKPGTEIRKGQTVGILSKSNNCVIIAEFDAPEFTKIDSIISFRISKLDGSVDVEGKLLKGNTIENGKLKCTIGIEKNNTSLRMNELVRVSLKGLRHNQPMQ